MVAVVFSVTAFKIPTPKPFLVRPDILKALIKFTLAGLSIISSLVCTVGYFDGFPPILLEYTRFPLLNKSVPSVKKGLFSLNCCSKGPKFKI